MTQVSRRRERERERERRRGILCRLLVYYCLCKANVPMIHGEKRILDLSPAHSTECLSRLSPLFDSKVANKKWPIGGMMTWMQRGDSITLATFPFSLLLSFFLSLSSLPLSLACASLLEHLNEMLRILRTILVVLFICGSRDGHSYASWIVRDTESTGEKEEQNAGPSKIAKKPTGPL